jgi:hypothetical protein
MPAGRLVHHSDRRAISIDRLHRTAGRGRHRHLDRLPRRFVWQRPGRVDDRVVQDRADPPPPRPLHAWTTWSWPPWSGSTGTSADGCTAPADDLPPAEYDARYALRATTPTLTRATSAPLDVAIYRMAATVPLYAQPEIVQGQHCTRRCHRATGRPRRVTTLPCRYIHGRLLQEATRRLRLNLGICSGCVLAPSRSAEGETRLGLSAPPGGLQ